MVKSLVLLKEQCVVNAAKCQKCIQLLSIYEALRIISYHSLLLSIKDMWHLK